MNLLSKLKSLNRKLDYRICTFMIIGTIAIAGSATLPGAKLLEEVNLGLRTSEVNSVREGTVIDKTYSKGHVYYTTTYTMKVPVTKPNFIPGHWSMTISIEKKDGQKTEKTIRVSEEEYNSNEIGDTYTFK